MKQGCNIVTLRKESNNVLFKINQEILEKMNIFRREEDSMSFSSQFQCCYNRRYLFLNSTVPFHPSILQKKIAIRNK